MSELNIQSPLSGIYSEIYSPKHHSRVDGNAETYQQYIQNRFKSNRTPVQQKERSNNQKTVSGTKKRQQKSKTKNKNKKNKRQDNKKTKKRFNPKDYQINPMYASQISQNLSFISIPHEQIKIQKNNLIKLQSRISTELLQLRQQKIIALENLNKVTDRKNKIIELIKTVHVFEKTSRLKQQNNQQNSSSRLNSSPHSKSPNRPIYYPTMLSQNNLINSKIQQQVKAVTNTLNEAGKIRDELMKPLAGQHPLLLKNKELKIELESLRNEIKIDGEKKEKIENQIRYYQLQNQKLQGQLQIHQQKLTKIENSRFQTFFPKDKKRIQQINALISQQSSLQSRKQSLTQQILNGTIIRRASDQLIIQQLRQQNRRLLADCNRLMGSQNSHQDQLYSLNVEQLQQMVRKQGQSRRVFETMLQNFKLKIRQIQNENHQLKGKTGRSQFIKYNRESVYY